MLESHMTRELARIAEARRILDVVHSPAELDAMPPNRILGDAGAFEDAYGNARCGPGAW